MEKLLRDSKGLLFPLAVVVVLVALSVGIGNFLLGRIKTVQADIDKINSENSVLTERLDTLRSVESKVTSSVKAVSNAIPSGNPSALISKQIRKKAADRTIAITKLSIGENTSSNTSTGDGTEPVENKTLTYFVNFEASGEDYDTLSAFIDDLSSIQPLINLDQLVVEEGSSTQGGIKARVSMSAFSSPFPETLPALQESISGLTPGEEETLSLLEAFELPESVSEPVPTEVTPRANPFSLDI